MRQRVGTNVCGNLSKRPQQSQLLFEFQSPGYPCWEMRAGRSRDWSLFICTCPYCSLKGSSNPIKALCSKKKWFLSCTPFVGPASPSPSMSKNSITRPLTTSWTAWSFDQPCETFFFGNSYPISHLWGYIVINGNVGRYALTRRRKWSTSLLIPTMLWHPGSTFKEGFWAQPFQPWCFENQDII